MQMPNSRSRCSRKERRRVRKRSRSQASLMSVESMEIELKARTGWPMTRRGATVRQERSTMEGVKAAKVRVRYLIHSMDSLQSSSVSSTRAQLLVSSSIKSLPLRTRLKAIRSTKSARQHLYSSRSTQSKILQSTSLMESLQLRASQTQMALPSLTRILRSKARFTKWTCRRLSQSLKRKS